MAKKKIDIDVTGMTLQDVMDLDPIHVKGLSDRSLARLTSRLVSAYNKRAKRLEQSGLAESSPAYRMMEQYGTTRLSVRGLDHNQLVSVYARARHALQENETLSIGGTRKMIRATEERLGHSFADKNEANRFWDVVDKLKEMNIGNDKRTSADIQREVADMMLSDGMSGDEVLAHYGTIIEAESPSLQEETDWLMGLGDEEEYEEYEFEEDWE